MEADVDNDTCGPVELFGQHAEFELGTLEETELTHESFGVHRPTFTVSRVPHGQPMGPTQPIGVRHRRGDLEVMARETLVVGRGDLVVERELGLVANRIPHTPGAAEVLARAGVVGAERASRRRNVHRDVVDAGIHVEV